MTYRRKRALLSLILGAVLTLASLYLRAADPALLANLRGSGFDTLQRIWPRQLQAPQPVRIVDIDEASLKELGQWPWPRDILAKLTTRLIDMGAAAVTFDVVFPEADRLSPRRVIATLPDAKTIASADLPDNDLIFAQALANGPTVLAIAASDTPANEQAMSKAGFVQSGADAYFATAPVRGATTNIEPLTAATKGLGIINFDLAGEQGVARQIPFLWSNGSRYFPALVPEALRVAQGSDTYIVNADPDDEGILNSLRVGEIDIPLTETGQFYVYYRPHDPSLYVSAKDVIADNPSADVISKIEGHIIFVGTSAVGLLDIRTNTLGEAIPGVSVHAQATEQILGQQFLQRPEWLAGGEFLSILICGLVLTAASIWLRPWQALGCYLGLTIWLLFSSAIAFNHMSLLMDITFPWLAATVTFLSGIAMRLLVTDREGRHLRHAFSHYVARSVLKEIEANPQALKLGGEMRDVTVMFVDIENFTPLSGTLPAQALVSIVNQLLDAATEAILKNKGTIDKYIGDAVMAFWNAPVPVVDHQAHAARAALDVRDAIAALNDKPEIAAILKQYNLPRLTMRAGICSGPACVGNMGSSTRFDYSVLGETVNIAARTEPACKHLMSEITIAGELTDATRKLRPVFAGNVQLKGKADRVPLHAIFDQHTDEQALTELAGLIAGFAKQPTSKKIKQSIADFAERNPSLKKFALRILARAEDF